MLRAAGTLLVGLAAACLPLLAACGPPDPEPRRQLEERGVEPTDEAFLDAVAAGDRESLRLLLALGIRPEAALLRAVRSERCDLLGELVAGGVAVDGVSAARALLHARREGLDECVAVLEEGGARHDARTEAGENQLTFAIAAGRTRAIRKMLAAGFPVDTPNSRGETGLLVAARTGNEEILALLLERGAAPDTRDVDGWGALAWVAREGLEDPTRRLLEAGVTVDARDLAGWTPLAWAARRGHSSVALLLLAAGADPDAGSSASRTPLVWAAARGDADLAELLLAHGADPALPFDAVSPAEWAALNRHAELAARLRAAEEGR